MVAEVVSPIPGHDVDQRIGDRVREQDAWLIAGDGVARVGHHPGSSGRIHEHSALDIRSDERELDEHLFVDETRIPSRHYRTCPLQSARTLVLRWTRMAEREDRSFGWQRALMREPGDAAAAGARLA